MKLLLSGFIGAFIASFLSIIYNYITEQVRYRREIMLKVVEWADDIYERLQFLHIQRDRIYSEAKPALSGDEYWKMSKEVKAMLLSSKISAMVALVYGEREEVQKVNALQGELTKILETLYTSNKETWKELDRDISEKFEKIIDPLRISISRRFLVGSRVTSILKDFFKKLWRPKMKLKKIIAREGLVLLGIILVGLCIIGINFLCNAIYVENYVNTPEENKIGWQMISYAHYDAISVSGLLLIYFGYPIYLFIRFIIWAIKTLRER